MVQRTPFDIPDQMRNAADQSVAQAKQAFDQFMDATQKAVAQAEGSAKQMRDDAAEMSRQTLAYIEENIAASFDMAQRLVRARSVEEVAAIQQEFMRSQMAAASEQGKGLGGMMARAGAEAMDKARK
jgi:phasin